MSKKVSVAVDLTGGDFAPEAVIDGVRGASAENPELGLYLLGPPESLGLLTDVISKGRAKALATEQTIAMGEEAARAVRSKPRSSIVLGTKLVQNGQAHAFVSAGNTGAVIAAALLNIGRVKGVARPAIATVLPSLTGPVVLLDAGATVECKPAYLFQFALMAEAFSSVVLGKDRPRIGLLNVGEEKTKGSRTVQRAFEQLDKSSMDFVGNVEGRDVISGAADVVVTDGFTGNVVLKTLEGVIEVMFAGLKGMSEESLRAKAGGWLLKPAYREFKKYLSYEEYGGAHLLGVGGVCVIAHGKSQAQAIKNAILLAGRTAGNDLVAAIEGAISEQ